MYLRERGERRGQNAENRTSSLKEDVKGREKEGKRNPKPEQGKGRENMEGKGAANIRYYTDDGFSGVTLNRPGFQIFEIKEHPKNLRNQERDIPSGGGDSGK